MIEFNYSNGDIVSSPAVIVSGKTSATRSGLVQFVNNQNKVFPPQFYEVNNGQFKAFLHVSPGEPNAFEVHVLDRAHLNAQGFPENANKVVDSGLLTLFFNPLPQNKPVHLCLIVGKDSHGSYDMPSYKLNRGQVANLETAVQRLKVAGRMMQAFTQDEFHRMGLSNRSFQFVEETVHHQTLFGYNLDSPVAHQEVKVHVLRSPKTVAELRDPDLAQQNPNAKDDGGLFSHAIDLIKDTPELFNNYHDTAIQCAVMYGDSHWNKEFILTHAALGGGTNEVKLGIFGSHGLHSYPLTFPQISPSLVDATHLSTNEVANDCNECGTSWECLNICMGAFIHEIGHLFGSPHQTDGVMLRDYLWWNRSFMTRETECVRENTRGSEIGNDGSWPKECHWNIRDLLRYLYHDSFSIPIDNNDDSFKKHFETTLRPDNLYSDKDAPLLYPMKLGLVLVKSNSGIFMVELVSEDLARYHTAYYPKSYGGPGLQRQLTLDYNDCLQKIRLGWNDASDNFSVKILSTSGDLWIENFKEHCNLKDSIIRSDFGLGRGPIDGYKSALLGSVKGDMRFIGFDVNSVYKVRVYHGMALDGATFYFADTSSSAKPKAAPPVPPRNYLSKVMSKLSVNDAPASTGHGAGEATMGNQTPYYTDFDLQPGERIVKMSFRNGQWMDAMEIETDRGRKSGMLGNSEGGHLSTLESPGAGFLIVGMYGYTGGWMDGLGIIYAAV